MAAGNLMEYDPLNQEATLQLVFLIPQQCAGSLCIQLLAGDRVGSSQHGF